MVAVRKMSVSPTIADTIIVSSMPRGNEKSINPAKNSTRAPWSSSGKAVNMCGTYHLSRASDRICNTARASFDEKSEYD